MNPVVIKRGEKGGWLLGRPAKDAPEGTYYWTSYVNEVALVQGAAFKGTCPVCGAEMKEVDLADDFGRCAMEIVCSRADQHRK